MQSPTKEFRSQVPPLFLTHTLERLIKSYKLAHDEVSAGYQEEEAHDLFGHAVRARFEGVWRALRHLEAHKSAGITGSVEKNRRRTSHYTVMRCGFAAMTANAVEDPETIVRNANFRNVFAAPQIPLFGAPPVERPITDIYAIVLHGKVSRRNPGEVGFARIVFPMLDSTRSAIWKYHHEQIDLIAELGSVVQATQGVPEEKVLDVLRIELKRQKGIG